MTNSIFINITQESISIPVVYIEAFVMMFVSFLIGYVGARLYANLQYKKQTATYDQKIIELEKQVIKLKEENDRVPEDRYQKDRMDQDFEQVKFQKRAFSEHVLAETVEVITPQGINFDKIGRATREEKDDLQEIIGIGPYTETKLNDLGIYTYDQISKFSDEDIAIITDLIKFFPDRIKNDRWVAKANDLKFKKSQQNDNNHSKKKMMYEKTTR
ncbi:hypothetical protein EAX61_11395 [Dokdonia sinensis]|uniref:Uncharacterized protein n=1 Tax=Dokdonia sinensis TaxID=2479847 RepID=A0A3M0FXV4_9FLAO|nr:hypothetical protein [Dokdonia sinensis]RMB57345.1 hypothetical protein EAX61_11395 [Dokdonia sinensis]